MGKYVLLCIAILLPLLSGLLCYYIKKPAGRKIITGITAIAMFCVAGEFTALLLKSGGKLVISMEGMPFDIGWLIKLFDIALMVYIAYIGVTLKKPLIVLLTLLQFIPFIIFEIIMVPVEPENAFVIDYLSLIMILLISVIGPIITIFATGYMKEHEHHLGLKASRQPRFFLILYVFLGAMNAMVMTDNLSWMYLFWEVTTLCSFLLISHDGNAQAVKNAVRALWINLLGGIAFLSAIIVIYQNIGTLSISEISSAPHAAGMSGLLPLGLALLCFAGFTKSAMFPFQSWLLGAMVAPTPVSALLHSSTMVKAGVYLIIRMAPAYNGTMLGNVVAVAGGFTFAVASAIAISQRNGKRVLAYSTISNLGLIICCTGLGTNAALGAAMLLMIFHAVSKALLFLCIGTIEQGIGSRDIEDMQGLMKKMPFTTVITVIGMVSMMLPPFGVLMTKWLAIEAAVGQPMVLVTIILGSAFTVAFWAKWIGIILTMSYKPKLYKEDLSFSVRSSLIVLVSGVLAASMGIMPIYNRFVKPQLALFNVDSSTALTGNQGGLWVHNSDNLIVGGFDSIVLFLVIFAIMTIIPYLLHRTRPEDVKPPYLCGENTEDRRGIEFTSPGDKIDNVVVHNYYMSGVFGEEKMTLWANFAAVAIILIMFGVII